MKEANQGGNKLQWIPQCLPVLFVIVIILWLYFVYIFWHCIPMLQLDREVALRDHTMATRGMNELIIFLVLSTMLDICYIRSIVTNPGEIPNSKEWKFFGDGREGEGNTLTGITETKRDGAKRHCKWCHKYKPDRCHHCRVCRTCVLKMDHHCPWIYNCVGYKNHKFFFLLLFYTFLCTQLICWTMFESMKRAVDDDIAFFDMFILLFGETLCGFLSVLVTGFFGFHIWLMFSAMSTIEFCEKKHKNAGYAGSVYHKGVLGNIQEVMGRNPLFWLLPVADYMGNGLVFDRADRLGPNENTRLVETPKKPHLDRRDGAAAPLLTDEEMQIGAPPGTTGSLPGSLRPRD